MFGFTGIAAAAAGNREIFVLPVSDYLSCAHLINRHSAGFHGKDRVLANSVRAACAVLLLASACSSSAEIRTFKIDPARTSVEFQLRHHLFSTVTGRFHDVQGVLHIDVQQPENSSVTATCPSKTLETGNPSRDENLRSELFEVEKFPELAFRSRNVVRTGTDQADVSGDLTLHGVTHEITLHVTLLERSTSSDGVEISRWRATATNLSRKSFGLLWRPVKEAVLVIGDRFVFRIECEAVASH